MKTLATMFALLAASAAMAQPPSLESTAGDVKRLVRDLKEKAAAAPANKVAPAAITGIYVDSDCREIRFEAAGPNVSQPVSLESRTWIEECDEIPMPRGGGTCIPRGRRLLSNDTATAVVELAERGTPATTEKFEACLWGRSLSLRVSKSPFKYSWTEKAGRFVVRLKK